MSACIGTGSCIQQCCCICDDESEVCTCGHRDHIKQVAGGDIYCQIPCKHNCTLVECHNFKFCGKKLPLQVLNVYNGMCPNCAVMLGKLTFLEEKGDCPICLDNKDMIVISCGKHNVCMDCWKTLSETENIPIPLTCPLCRESIWKWRIRPKS